MTNVAEQLTDIAVSLAVALVLVLIGYVIVRLVLLRFFRRIMRRYGIDKVFVDFASVILNILLLAFVVIIALSSVGIPTGFLIATLAAVLLAVAAAMQGWLQNIAAGFWMLVVQPFRLNDSVEIAGKKGNVVEISLLTTTLRTGENLQIILPNRTIVGAIITNYHANTERRIELAVQVAYDADIQQAIDVIWTVIRSDPRILTEPQPLVEVAELGSIGVKLDVKVWTSQEDFSATRYALRKSIKVAFDTHHIPFAYQQIKLVSSKIDENSGT